MIAYYALTPPPPTHTHKLTVTVIPFNYTITYNVMDIFLLLKDNRYCHFKWHRTTILLTKITYDQFSFNFNNKNHLKMKFIIRFPN